MQRRRYRAKGGRVDTVPRPFKLDAFEAMRRLVHLKKYHDRHAADGFAVQDDIDVTVAKIERVRQPRRNRPEFVE